MHFREAIMSSSSEARRLALLLASHFASAGVTQNALAIAIDASQSQVSRILSGRIVRHTKLLERLCIYASRRLKFHRRRDVRQNAELMSALTDVWDGSDEHAQALAHVIRSLAELDELRERFVRWEARH
ncbi:helix-turn-helix domain-containing protein [Paraburkholderia strydomiana]|uniref:helix-turn-helix domain-containing protein n=1 Tax=Paraburkholderia strydomiana TaxID=1245417 RepID=UPI0038B98FC1